MRHVKQLLYGIFYLALWAGLIGGLYALQKPTPSCFDGKKNQNEGGIDCGGGCARVCIPTNIAPLASNGDPKMVILAAPATSTAAARISLVAEVENRNVDFGATSFDYLFKVYDQNGGSIAAFPATSFIYPGEIKRVSLLNALLPAGRTPAYAKITIENPIWTFIDRFPKPRLIIQTSGSSEANGTITTQGVLVNQDSVNFPVVYLTAVYYDRTGRVVGVSGTERNNVTAGESRDFALFHPGLPEAALERTQVFVTAFNPR